MQRNNPQRFVGGKKVKKTTHGCDNCVYGLMMLSCHRGNGVENKREHNVHLSLKPDPNAKGSYLRRMQDIQRALDALEADKLPDVVKFIAYYFGCEKLAYVIVGIHKRLPADKAFQRKLKLSDVKAAALDIQLKSLPADLDWLFADHNEQSILQSTMPLCTFSARHLRNKLGHQLGPTHVALIREHAPFHIPRMQTFLKSPHQVLAYQKLHFGHLG